MQSSEAPSDAQKAEKGFGLGINVYAIYLSDVSEDPITKVESDGARYPQWIY
jgi:hypothetical protein